MNAPARHELYVLEEGEKPVEITDDTKIPNAATVRVVKQDHTLANMVRGELLKMNNVLFAGYKVPHPLHPYFLIKLQTDGSETPIKVLGQACTKLIGDLSSLEQKFQREFSFKDVRVDGPAGDDPYGTGTGGQAWAAGRDYLDF